MLGSGASDLGKPTARQYSECPQDTHCLTCVHTCTPEALDISGVSPYNPVNQSIGPPLILVRGPQLRADTALRPKLSSHWSPSPAAPSGVFYREGPISPWARPIFILLFFKIKSKYWEGVQGGVTELRWSSFRLISTPALSVTPLWGAPLTQACHWAPREWVRRVRARRALGLGHWPRVPKGPYSH